MSPLTKAVPKRTTPELEYLQAKWATHLPYRQATELLQEVFPLGRGISLGSTRRRILAVGHALDAHIEHDIVSRPKPKQGDEVRESKRRAVHLVGSVFTNQSKIVAFRPRSHDCELRPLGDCHGI